ncbi:hypothetical protein BJ742DRAFT_803570 [Cladochytrium replicatum]|nr:hypothetical protein BJ742DRAFT_803570 [Cladochytrium replicatum]
MANFRTKYFQGLGNVAPMEVTTSLESALNEEPLKIDKLCTICLWVRIPHAYRPIVWKFILGVLPQWKGDKNVLWKLVEEARNCRFEDLKSAIPCIFGGEPVPERPCPRRLVEMLLIETNSRNSNKLPKINTNDPQYVVLESIAYGFSVICDDGRPDDAFWLFKHFVQKHLGWDGPGSPVVKKLKTQTKQYISSLNVLLREYPELRDQIERLGVNLESCCSMWFETLFSRILTIKSLESIWDVYLGGANDILCHVALSLLIATKARILEMNDATEFKLMTDDIKQYADMDAVASRAIRLWENPVLKKLTPETRKLIGMT